MDRKDRERDEYSRHYTGRHWDNLNEYDMTVETSLFGIEGTANMIIDAAEKQVSLNHELFFYRTVIYRAYNHSYYFITSILTNS